MFVQIMCQMKNFLAQNLGKFLSLLPGRPSFLSQHEHLDRKFFLSSPIPTFRMNGHLPTGGGGGGGRWAGAARSACTF